MSDASCIRNPVVVGLVGDITSGLAGLLGGDPLAAERKATVGAGQAFVTCTSRTSGNVVNRYFDLGLATAPSPAGPPPPPVVTPVMLAARASAQLVVELPQPAASPGLDRWHLVGLPSWFWLTDWRTLNRTASIPGLSATVSARPVRTTWDFGPAGTLVCQGPGTPYDLSRSPGSQSTDCQKTFIQPGVLHARVTVDWALSWSGSTGATGTLPGVARTATFDLDVRAAQAVGD